MSIFLCVCPSVYDFAGDWRFALQVREEEDKAKTLAVLNRLQNSYLTLHADKRNRSAGVGVLL